MTTIDPAVLARARGAWLGQIAGDALGTTVEFKSPARIRELYPDGLRRIVGGGPFSVKAGQVTDDTELALALARSLSERGGYEPDAVAGAYLAWYASGPFDVGGTTAAAFGGHVRPGPGAAARIAQRASRSSQANGALMRLAPLAIWGWRLPPDDLAALAAFDARLSHPNDACQAASAVFAVAVAAAIREGAGPRATWERALAFAREHAACAPALDTLAQAEAGPPADYVKNMGWVRIALHNAFFQLLHAPTLEEGIVDTVMRGGDTDTNACIAGALLGAVHGEAAVPRQWRETILGCRTARGPTFQVDDALELAARLAEAGATPRPLPDLAGALAAPLDAGLDEDDDDDALDDVDDVDHEEVEYDHEGLDDPGTASGEDLDDDDDPEDTWDAPDLDEEEDDVDDADHEEVDQDETRHLGGPGQGDAGPLFGR